MGQQGGEGAGRRRSDFLLARLGHDIRTPMNSIVGLSHLCLQTELNKVQKDYLEKIQSAADILVDIVNDILDYSRIESGRMELQSIPFQVADLLQKVSDTVVLRAEKKGLEVLIRVAQDVPDYLEGDANRLCQALVNLASNAVRFTQKGEIIINVEILERRDESLHVHFAIQDTGIGMSREQVEHIGHYFSLSPANMLPEAHPNAGFGLAIAHMLVRLMDGTIWVESEAEHGSTFHISLWLRAGAAPRPRTVPAGLLRNLHVLVVDDNPSARIILTEALSSFGFRVESAESGQQVFGMLQQACEQNDPFALVLLDWKMPEMDGIATARHIRDDLAIKAPPQLLMVSASDTQDCLREGTEVGIRGFLRKPVTRSHLFDAIVRMFAREKSGPAGEAVAVALENASDRRRIDGLESLKGARILLVEDNEINQQIAMELLEQTGCVVTTANNGKDALDILLLQQFDAVLMDIQMPIMDGLEAARRARELPVPGIRVMPILAMTAHALESDKVKSLQAGMQEHLTKPIDPRKMYEALAKWIRSDKASGAGHAQSGGAMPGGSGDMPGLSVQAALRNLGGNESLYIKLLSRFVANYEHAPRQVSDALEAGDQQLAVRLAHTIKGVAANLGALSLASVAGDLESALAANMEHSALLTQMREVLRQTVESMRRVIEVSQEPGATVVRQSMSAERQAEVIAFLRVAPKSMSSDWSSVQQGLKEFESLLGHSATASAYAALMQAVDDFDADAAQVQAEKIIALLH